MYVNPFWFGVLVTVVVEILGLFTFALISINRGQKK